MRRFMLVCVMLACCGCSGPPPVVQRELTEADIKETLRQIAESGEWRQDVLNDLSAGLEREGHMQQAALVQQISALQETRKIKSLAREIMTSLK